ncbi:phage tail terminator-like protein [Pseudomonas coleopterorum]|uniref:phage tail terminator-like protein n=1 Tax=Pseudomonas coleopterorum TaxID=1605838 RepID=UPI00089B9B13|nr:phage tail terminator-like protein [Pseudomonas coleopterorum]SEE13945.1 Bacteriophage related protein of unknown function [Pseudomonas coleopterorum]SEE38862.1 Bacteriophage related protein of unknown function [Pseudomonas coleopterorum]
MTHATIRKIYEARLQAWAAARVPALRIAYQGDKFEPQAGETYLAAFTLPASVDSQDLQGAHRLYLGIFQVSIVTPAGKGAGSAEAIADELAALFPLNLRLTRDGMTVMVYTPVEPGPGISEDATYTVPVSFRYRSDTI